MKHFEAENHCYFVTTTTEKRNRVFVDREHCQILCNMLFNMRARGKFLLIGFVTMPDHLHVLLVPRGGTTLPEIMRDLKKGSARLIGRRLGRAGKIWMDEYYETAIRSEEQLLAALIYIHQNPVKAGLAATPEGFLFCSANPAFDSDLGLAMGETAGVEDDPGYRVRERMLGWRTTPATG